MRNTLYYKIKHYKSYINRYGSTILIKHIDYPNIIPTKKLCLKNFSSMYTSKYSDGKNNSIINNPFLL